MAKENVPQDSGDEQTETRASYRINFETNQILDAVVDRLRTTPIDWEALIPVMAALPDLSPGVFAEAHINHLLAQARAEFGKEAVNLRPIPNDATTEHYRFRIDKAGQVYAYDLATGNAIVEYDDIAEIEGLPVVFQARIVRTKNRGKTRQVFQQLLTPKGVNDKLKPLEEYFGERTPFGIVVVTVPEADRPRSPIQQHFIEAGGKFVVLPTTYDQFHLDARSAKNEVRRRYPHRKPVRPLPPPDPFRIRRL